MSTSGEQAGRPLTRRELRELRAKGGEQAVREALDASAASSAPESAPDPQIVASAPSAGDEHPPLTRKEWRRLRTNEVPVVTPEMEAARREEAEQGADEDPSDAAAADETEQDTDETPEATAGDVADAESEQDPDDEVADDGDAADPDESPSEAAADSEEPGSEESEQDEAEPGEQEPGEGADRGTEPEASSDDAPLSTTGSSLDPSFGADVSVTRTHTNRGSFDDLMEQSVSTSPSSIIMTSSHRLPEGLGSTGAAQGTTDGRDVDAVLIDGELPPSSSPTPIAASEAISTQKSASDVIRPPSPERGRGLLLTLGITAGVLGIVAIGTLATLYFTGVFDQ